MKKTLWIIMAALTLVAAPIWVMAADKKEEVIAKEVELTGEPIDVLCYFTGKSGPGHAGCAAACVGGGKPAGLLVSEKHDDKEVNQIYLVVGAKGKKPADIFNSLWGEQVKVKGKLTSKDGIKVIEVAEAMAAE